MGGGAVVVGVVGVVVVVLVGVGVVAVGWTAVLDVGGCSVVPGECGLGGHLGEHLGGL